MCQAATEKLGPSLFLLDNAAYHKRLENEKLRMRYWQTLPAADVKAAWTTGTVPGQLPEHGQLTTKAAIIKHLRSNMPAGQLKVERIAATEGHEVLFLPPYRPELNAIETAWGVTKNFVARNNLPSVSFNDLRDVIQRGFAEASVACWNKLDSKIVCTEQQQLEVLLSEKERLDQFREDHPDLIFTVRAESDSDSDCGSEAGEEDVLAHLEAGLQENEIPPSAQHNGLEIEVAHTLASCFSQVEVNTSSGSVTEE